MSETAVVAQATPSGSLESASTAIAGLLSREDKEPTAKTQPEPQAKKETPDKQVPAAPEAKSPESEQEPSAVDDEESDQPPPPKLWKVPVDGQELEVPEDELVKGYSRTADYTRKTQELAKQRREFEEGELKVARETRTQQQQLLTELKSAIVSLAPVEPNWDKLKNELPPEQFADRVLDWKTRQDHLSKIDAEQSRLKAEADAEAMKGFQAYVAEQQQHLERELPELKDPEKAKVIRGELSAFAKSRGFSDDELGQVTDHRLVILLHDAMQHQKAKAKAPEIKNKIEQAIEAAPPSKPTTTAKRSEKDNAFAKAAKSGRVEDAAKFFEKLID
jgi:hypothetical protein